MFKKPLNLKKRLTSTLFYDILPLTVAVSQSKDKVAHIKSLSLINLFKFKPLRTEKKNLEIFKILHKLYSKLEFNDFRTFFTILYSKHKLFHN